ncbi:Bicyclomycin resistance protein [Planctomycetes bacterium Pan216]|uniref:Bicyclomycin resistance protein n=1 Tax=Kolteria novifilia TaxID=2527975 RepID=A0A518B7U0_9BACT|nr:Bicyclomycin resistance protein [Planctomycetes bacterium Pan216]
MTSSPTSVATRAAVPSLLILAYMSAVGPFGDTEYTPSLPRIARELHVTYGTAQLTMSSYLLGYALSQLLYGPFSDRFGRKPIMLFGAVMFLIGSIICAMSPTIRMLIGGRFVQSIGACAGGVIVNAAVRDAFAPAERARMLMKVDVVFALAPGLGPVAGAFIDNYFGWQANFMLLALMGAILLLATALFFPETNHNKNMSAITPSRIAGNYLIVIENGRFLYHGTLLGIAVAVMYCCLVEAPSLVMDTLGLPSSWFAVVAATLVVSFMVGTLACGLLERRLRVESRILIGYLIMMAGTIWMVVVAFGGFVTFWHMMVPIMVVFTGIAFVLPLAAAQAMAPFRDVAGSASAMLGFLEMGIPSLGTFGVSVLNESPAKDMAVSFLVLCGVALILIAFGSLLEARGVTLESAPEE